MKLTDINWDLLKFEYEVLGVSLEELEVKYDISSTVLQYNARNWAQIPATKRKSLQFTRLEDLDSLTTDVVNQVKRESELISTIKQKFLLPKYLELENLLLNKAIELVHNLDSQHHTSVHSVYKLTQTLTQLLALNPLLAQQTDEVDSAEDISKEWTIKVVDARDAGTTDTEKTSPICNEKEEV